MDIKGWPDTDPYPYRGLDGPFRCAPKPPDTTFVTHHKEYVSEEAPEVDDRGYYLRLAWDEINRLAVELQQAKDHIQWLKNTGGEQLNMACGIDILCRGFDKKKEKEAITQTGS